MTTRTETDPSLPESDTGDGDGYAHYADKAEITRAAIEGGTVVALCGFRFSPIRDPQRFPVCPKCKELAGSFAHGERWSVEGVGIHRVFLGVRGVGWGRRPAASGAGLAVARVGG
jgi:hypothetical protein